MRPAAENMLPANVRVRTNPVNAAALPELRLALSTGRRLIHLAKIVVPIPVRQGQNLSSVPSVREKSKFRQQNAAQPVIDANQKLPNFLPTAVQAAREMATLLTTREMATLHQKPLKFNVNRRKLLIWFMNTIAREQHISEKPVKYAELMKPVMENVKSPVRSA